MLLEGPCGGQFPMSEVPLYLSPLTLDFQATSRTIISNILSNQYGEGKVPSDPEPQILYPNLTNSALTSVGWWET